jgi:hypothetical protein
MQPAALHIACLNLARSMRARGGADEMASGAVKKDDTAEEVNVTEAAVVGLSVQVESI